MIKKREMISSILYLVSATHSATNKSTSFAPLHDTLRPKKTQEVKKKRKEKEKNKKANED